MPAPALDLTTSLRGELTEPTPRVVLTRGGRGGGVSRQSGTWFQKCGNTYRCTVHCYSDKDVVLERRGGGGSPGLRDGSTDHTDSLHRQKLPTKSKNRKTSEGKKANRVDTAIVERGRLYTGATCTDTVQSSKSAERHQIYRESGADRAGLCGRTLRSVKNGAGGGAGGGRVLHAPQPSLTVWYWSREGFGTWGPEAGCDSGRLGVF